MMEYIYAILIILVSFYFYVTNSFSLNPFLARRSIVRYRKDKVVSQILIVDAVSAAIKAPNHFLTEPWRFYICGEETVDKIINLNKEKEEQFKSIPNWMVVTMNTQYVPGSKLFLEDHAACSAAIQTFMLFMASKGVGSKWMTGALQINPSDILKILDCGEEIFIGVIWFGYPENELSEKARAPIRNLGLKTMVKLP